MRGRRSRPPGARLPRLRIWCGAVSVHASADAIATSSTGRPGVALADWCSRIGSRPASTIGTSRNRGEHAESGDREAGASRLLVPIDDGERQQHRAGQTEDERRQPSTREPAVADDEQRRGECGGGGSTDQRPRRAQRCQKDDDRDRQLADRQCQQRQHGHEETAERGRQAARRRRVAETPVDAVEHRLQPWHVGRRDAHLPGAVAVRYGDEARSAASSDIEAQLVQMRVVNHLADPGVLLPRQAGLLERDDRASVTSCRWSLARPTAWAWMPAARRMSLMRRDRLG